MLYVLLIKHDKMNTLNVEGFFCVISLVCVFVKILLSTKSQVINLNYLRKTTPLNFQFTIQSGINLIICQEGIVIIRGRNKLWIHLSNTSITLVVGFHGEAISSGAKLENFSASSFVLKHLNLAPENFFTVCNANFLSVNTKV